ncbi:hypothetical protein, partial [Ralstonia sp. 1138]|uniref:hypothetical protein n=1 Tax=Ralstonia sp. 1138 TaxID=3156423 RepID=UPI003392161D
VRMVSSGQFKSSLLGAGDARGNGVNVPAMVAPQKQDTDRAKQFDVKVIGSGINLRAANP